MVLGQTVGLWFYSSVALLSTFSTSFIKVNSPFLHNPPHYSTKIFFSPLCLVFYFYHYTGIILKMILWFDQILGRFYSLLVGLLKTQMCRQDSWFSSKPCGYWPVSFEVIPKSCGKAWGRMKALTFFEKGKKNCNRLTKQKKMICFGHYRVELQSVTCRGHKTPRGTQKASAGHSLFTRVNMLKVKWEELKLDAKIAKS